MPWNDKCQWGTPKGFTDLDAARAVDNANYNGAVYVNISQVEGRTKQAFTYYEFGGYRLCVVAHVHADDSGRFTQPGSCYIPGWEDWSLRAPPRVVAAVGPLYPGGGFPGDHRYPHPLT